MEEVHTINCGGYKTFLGKAALPLLGHFLEGEKMVNANHFILADENTVEHCLPILKDQVPVLGEAEVLEIESGEEQKQMETVDGLWNALLDLGADRQSILINLGGGVISDLGGFVAGTYKRGIRFINVPTSLLAQVDASAGSKTGFNHGGIKNLVGLFNAPSAIFIDENFLHTLPRRHLLSGFGEMFKHALIADASLWEELSEMEPGVGGLDDLLYRSIDIKNKIVLEDPRDSGVRKKLNFGHTIGHAIEAFSLEGSGKSLIHGEAVAIGLICESFISHKAGYIRLHTMEQIAHVLDRLYPRFKMESMDNHRIIELMRADKKNLGGAINFTLLKGLGKAVIDQEVPTDKIIDALNYYNRLP